ncbi:MAG: RHS repeat-associated core domain-containing protein [Bacillota bacterium]
MRSVLPAYLSSGTLTRVLKYFYNNDGNLQFLLSKSDNFSNSKAYNLYYYVRDALGNITSLLKVKTQNGSIGTTDTKTLVAEYKYDAYGQIISATRPSGVTDDIYQVNPICYKDYYYDADTGWYNLTTRYYDPVVGRFISADDVSLIAESTDEMGDKNLYAYCDNNPISRADKGGEIWNFVIGAAIGAGIEIASQVITSGKITNWKAVGLSAAMGTIGGGAVGKVVGLAAKATKAVKKAKPIIKAAKTAKIEKIGKLKPANRKETSHGIRFRYKSGNKVKRRSLEFHYKHRHAGRRIHWQLNSWKWQKRKYNSYAIKHWTWYGKRLPK